MNKGIIGVLTTFLLLSVSTNNAFSAGTSANKTGNTTLKITPADTAMEVAAVSTSQPKVNTYYMKVDGIAVSPLKSFDGGAISARAVSTQQSNSYYPDKSNGSTKYEDATIQAYLYSGSGSTDFFRWIAASWTGDYSSKDVDIIGAENTTARMQLTFTDAYLTETKFPTLDNGTSTSTNGYITVKVSPASISCSSSGNLSGFSSGTAKHWQTKNFQLTIDNLDCTKVTRIESFSITGTSTSTTSGDSQYSGQTSWSTECSNLKITLNDPYPQQWVDWHNNMVIRGESGLEKNGSLSLRNASNQEILGLNLYNLGICGLTLPTTSNSNKTVIELYCERVEKR